ncbi:hypothetical protein BN1088_1431293 [Sphingobacterium sp. PM2-P1-29]|nr:hypothetical protein BN1088_1431293 [Sphingobacterium sp. PM2-P1-29]
MISNPRLIRNVTIALNWNITDNYEKIYFEHSFIDVDTFFLRQKGGRASYPRR